MRKPIKKILALFLAFLLAGVSGGFSPQQIFAQTPEQKQPSVAEKTTTSITFTTDNDLEYAIQTEKPDTDEETKETSQKTDKAKDMVWTWAKEEPSVPIDTKPQENHSPTVDTNSQNVDSSTANNK